MDNSKTHERVKELIIRELDKIADKGSLTPQELHSVYEAYDVLKDICELKEKDENYGYSERGYSMWGPNHDRYYDIHAYRNRDSMGRYSRTDAKEHMINGLYSMKDDASNEADRGAIQECINKLRA